jgi:hypothetical protein
MLGVTLQRWSTSRAPTQRADAPTQPRAPMTARIQELAKGKWHPKYPPDDMAAACDAMVAAGGFFVPWAKSPPPPPPHLRLIIDRVADIFLILPEGTTGLSEIYCAVRTQKYHKSYRCCGVRPISPMPRAFRLRLRAFAYLRIPRTTIRVGAAALQASWAGGWWRTRGGALQPSSARL